LRFLLLSCDTAETGASEVRTDKAVRE